MPARPREPAHLSPPPPAPAARAAMLWRPVWSMVQLAATALQDGWQGSSQVGAGRRN